MRKKASSLAAMAVVLALTASGCGADIPNAEASNSGDFSDNAPQPHPIIRKGEYLSCNFYDRRSFRIFDETSKAYKLTGKLTSGVVTHHLLAGEMISSFFKAASENRQAIETVVIIAPSHYSNEMKSNLITTCAGWQTDFGEVECDSEITEKFTSQLGAVQDDEMMTRDHSASTFLPFIRYYLPEAKTACLLISPRADREVPEKAAKLLYDISLEKSCLFLFSADFSHYLDPETAQKRDGETLAAIMSRDIKSIEPMTDDHTDTPRCICTFIHLTELQQASITVLDRSDSAEQAGLPYNRGNFPEGVTSYFILSGEIDE